jgi:hypothetical protein
MFATNQCQNSARVLNNRTADLHSLPGRCTDKKFGENLHVNKAILTGLGEMSGNIIFHGKMRETFSEMKKKLL